MEHVLAQLGAIFIRHAIKNPRVQQDEDLYTLIRIPTQANANETSEQPATSGGDSGLNHVLKPDTQTGQTQTYVVPRASFNNEAFTLTENDLIQNDTITSLKDQYLYWRQIYAEDNAHTSVLDRFVATAKRLNTLKEEIGSMPLEMTYLYLFSNYQEYKFGKSVPSFTKKNEGPCNAILQRLYAEEWEHFNERIKLRHCRKLQRQVYIGRRWSITVEHLSFGAIILAGKKISTLIHQKNFKLADLDDPILRHILFKFMTYIRRLAALNERRRHQTLCIARKPLAN